MVVVVVVVMAVVVAVPLIVGGGGGAYSAVLGKGLETEGPEATPRACCRRTALEQPLLGALSPAG
jgi:hypothetical protein